MRALWLPLCVRGLKCSVPYSIFAARSQLSVRCLSVLLLLLSSFTLAAALHLYHCVGPGAGRQRWLDSWKKEPATGR